MIPVVNPTNAPIWFMSNGGTWIFPPSDSQEYWYVTETPKGVGESPYEIKSSPTPVERSVRGPMISIPEYVAADAKTGRNRARGTDQLKFGSEALKVAQLEHEKMNQIRKEELAELAKTRAALEAEKLALAQAELATQRAKGRIGETERR